GQWTTIDASFEAKSSAYDFMFLETPWSTDIATFVIDDFKLSKGAEATPPVATEPPAVVGNLLPDGRFVDNWDGWTTRMGGTLSLSGDAASGANSLKVTDRTATQSGPFASVSGALETGAVYKLSGKLKYSDGADKQQFNFTF